jgi:hypothetical protein
MIRLGTLTVLAVWLTLTSTVSAQTAPWRFQWKKGQVLTYRFEQTTSVVDVVGGTEAKTATKLNEHKRWQVLDVDAAGIATLQLSLTSLRIENTTPSGEVLLFDSENADKSNPQMKEQLTKYLGQPLAVLRIDGRGKVIEVKESKFGPASRFDSEPPFIAVLPEATPKPGQWWERPYQITLEPPQGTGEKFPATQKYTCKTVDAKGAVLSVATTIGKPPAAVADQVPLLHMQPEGEIIFDPQTGILRSAHLQIDREVKGHQGEDSSYHVKSTSTEEYVSPP